jgi:L-phenylalanine/L-methionine N-acetyltransferase
MDLVIRHVKEQDHEAVHEILTSPHVLSGSMRVPFAPLQQTRERLTPTRGIYQLVAEAEDRVVGFGELITYSACSSSPTTPTQSASTNASGS